MPPYEKCHTYQRIIKERGNDFDLSEDDLIEISDELFKKNKDAFFDNKIKSILFSMIGDYVKRTCNVKDKKLSNILGNLENLVQHYDFFIAPAEKYKDILKQMYIKVAGLRALLYNNSGNISHRFQDLAITQYLNSCTLYTYLGMSVCKK
ncbi:hypothetical protein KY330_03450 [Candidatus Woesearchaeota archaeon]|nr:hypothetical protein [Candidatus Woesearchaeota archaeon]